MNTAVPDRAKFHHMKDGTLEDWTIIGAEVQAFSKTLYQRIIDHLLLLEGDCGGFPVDRLTHCLQTATLAHKDGKDEEYVVCALLHDIGDTLGPANHADIAAVLLQPYVSEENYWMVKRPVLVRLPARKTERCTQRNEQKANKRTHPKTGPPRRSGP